MSVRATTRPSQTLSSRHSARRAPFPSSCPQCPGCPTLIHRQIPWQASSTNHTRAHIMHCNEKTGCGAGIRSSPRRVCKRRRFTETVSARFGFSRMPPAEVHAQPYSQSQADARTLNHSAHICANVCTAQTRRDTHACRHRKWHRDAITCPCTICGPGRGRYGNPTVRGEEWDCGC